MSVDNGPVQLTALTSIRFFAALHILLFHLYEGHQYAKDEHQGLMLPVFDQIPQSAVNWLRHGYFSTSLFFLISGFILAYLYILPDGTMSKSRRSFWIARATRIYPLHLLILLLAAAFVFTVVAISWEERVELAVGWFLGAMLIQAWFPRYALSWNFPTWALSVVAFFYLAFPPMVRLLRRLSRAQLAMLLVSLPFVSLAPSLVFLAIHPDGGELHSFWHEFIMRLPLFWIPHFLMGMLLARIFRMSRFDLNWRQRAGASVAWGDLSFAAVIVISMLDISVPSLLLRHGLLAPLYLMTIYDLARDRGLLARLLCMPGMKLLGDASFSVFMLQFPVIMLVVIPASTINIPSVLAVALIVGATVLLSLLSTNYLEQPVSRWLRRRVIK